MESLQFVLGIAVVLAIIFNAERLPIKGQWFPAVAFAISLGMANIGYSEKITFLAVAGTFLGIISGFILCWQILNRFGVSNEVSVILLIILLIVWIVSQSHFS